MNESILKTIIHAKLTLAHTVIDLLPEAVQAPIRNTEQAFLQSMQESLKDFLEEPRHQEDTSTTGRGLKRIEVEGEEGL